VFSEGELDYLAGERRLARIATVGKDGTPHVVPVGFGYNPEHGPGDLAGSRCGAVPRRSTGPDR